MPQFRRELKGNENVLHASTVLEGRFQVDVALLSHPQGGTSGKNTGWAIRWAQQHGGTESSFVPLND